MKLSTVATACAGFITSTSSAPQSTSTKSAEPGIAVANIIAIHKPLVSSPDHSSWTETPYEVPLGKLTTFNQSITGLRLEGITVTVEDWPHPDKNQVICQRYRDPYAIYPGSATFNVTYDADISTNVVPFGWLLCMVKAKTY